MYQAVSLDDYTLELMYWTAGMDCVQKYSGQKAEEEEEEEEERKTSHQKLARRDLSCA